MLLRTRRQRNGAVSWTARGQPLKVDESTPYDDLPDGVRVIAHVAEDASLPHGRRPVSDRESGRSCHR